MSLILGVDIGGSHITSALVDLEKRAVVEGSLSRKHIDSHGTYPEIISSWASAMQESLKNGTSLDVKIGIAMPGPFNYEDGISLIRGVDKYESLYGKNIRNILASSLRVEPGNIRFKNDAACFLQGEMAAAHLDDCNKVIGITLGTGLGTSIYSNGTAVDAEMWASPLKGGIAEDIISTRWFVRRYHELTGSQVKGVKDLVEIHHRDQAARAIFNEFAENFSEFLRGFVTRENPEVIIVGGNISRASDYFLGEVTTLLASQNIHIPIRLAKLGENAALIGSVWQWQQPAKMMA